MQSFDLNTLLRSSLSPFDDIVHIIDIIMVGQIIQMICSSSLHNGAMTTMAGYQPNASPCPAEDAHVVQAIAIATAIKQPAVKDVPIADTAARRPSCLTTTAAATANAATSKATNTPDNVPIVDT
jgi:hypothetical protein